MSTAIFAANWKMHYGPDDARRFMEQFLGSYVAAPDREVWFFPAAVSLHTVAAIAEGRSDIRVGAQNVHWEPKGAFTGEVSVTMAKQAGAVTALVGHSERRHVFGETDEETASKVRALLAADVVPMLCVGETLDERNAGATEGVVHRQLSVLNGLERRELGKVLIAYEPVWAIGTGKNATPSDAANVHASVRTWLAGRGLAKDRARILYGGSVKPDNAAALLAESEIDGVLVGGASLDPGSWLEVVRTGLD